MCLIVVVIVTQKPVLFLPLLSPDLCPNKSSLASILEFPYGSHLDVLSPLLCSILFDILIQLVVSLDSLRCPTFVLFVGCSISLVRVLSPDNSSYLSCLWWFDFEPLLVDILTQE
jgi:hypothetical protein